MLTGKQDSGAPPRPPTVPVRQRHYVTASEPRLVAAIFLREINFNLTARGKKQTTEDIPTDTNGQLAVNRSPDGLGFPGLHNSVRRQTRGGAVLFLAC